MGFFTLWTLISVQVKTKALKDVLSTMPTAHRATLTALLRHLLRVVEQKEHNRMQIPNLAIVFGPTLMWPPPSANSGGAILQSQQNLALDMMQQNIIVETLLSNAQHIL